MGRTRLFAAIATVAACTTALLVAEGLVRLTVGMPVAPEPRDAGLPSLHEPDPVLGWRNRAGRIVWPGRGPDAGRPIVYTFEPGGRRAAGPAPVRDDRPTTVLLGCSYTQGWAVTDDETYAWRLQARFPELAVANLGTAGYGTHQSLLALERFLEAGGDPRLVVYGFIENHELRNVAPALWLRALAGATAAGPLAVPFATLDAGARLRRHPPERYPAWPLGDRLASVALLEARLADWRSAPRARQARSVTEALLAELGARSAARGATLLVAILEARPASRRHYTEWLAERGIRAIDCTDPRIGEKRYQVPGYGHPGREINATWAECVGTAVASLAPTARIP